MEPELARTPDLRRQMAAGAGALAEIFHWDKIAAEYAIAAEGRSIGLPAPPRI